MLDARSANESERRRFAREAVVMSGLEHDGICEVVDHGMDGEFLWFAMSYIAGVSLRKRLRQGALSVEDALSTFVRVADALQHVHDSGVLHRDVKPDNVMMRERDGLPVLVDFGIAIASDLDDDATRLTSVGEIRGTLNYLSPEQLEEEGVDARTDLYALGVTMYEALSGAMPFEAPTEKRLRERILTERPLLLSSLRSEVPCDLATVVAVAMEKHRDDRYESAAALAHDLRRVQRGEPIAATTAGIVRRVVLWSRRNRGWATTIAAATIVLLSVSVLASLAAVRADRMRKRSEQLAGKPAFETLVAMAKSELLVPDPARIRRFEQWLERADSLLAEMPTRREELDALRALAEPESELDRERERTFYALEYANLEDLDREEQRNGTLSEKREEYRRRLLERVAFRHQYTFADFEQQCRHDVLRDYVRLLERFAQPGIVNTHSRAAVAHRLDRARELSERLSGEDAAAWSWCCEQVLHDPRYAGLALEPISGLVPLGVDKASGLLEFWHVLSGVRPRWDGKALGPGRVVLGDKGDEGFVMVLLPGGSFRMGTDATTFADLDRGEDVYARAYADEAPTHDVELEPFFLSKFEVTCAQYERQFGSQRTVVGENLRGRDPQAWLTWDECELACRSWGLLLPTEAQWEYA